MLRKASKTDVSDSAWAVVGPRVPPPKTNGRKAPIPRRELLNALFYSTRSGCGWELLPPDFPHWKTVYHDVRLWRIAGIWEQIHTALRELVGVAAGRDPEPRAAIIDSQSVKTANAGGDDRGDDGGKKVHGRKRHLGVDTQGLVLNMKVHAADSADRDGAAQVLEGMPERFPRLQKLWTDSGYNGRFRTWAAAHWPWSVEIVKHWWTGVRGFWLAPGQEPPTIPQGFHVLPRRWVVERTLAWLGHNRRLHNDYERLASTSETFIYLAMMRLMLRRLARNPPKQQNTAS